MTFNLFVSNLLFIYNDFNLIIIIIYDIKKLKFIIYRQNNKKN